jgi:hypothetical protein
MTITRVQAAIIRSSRRAKGRNQKSHNSFTKNAIATKILECKAFEHNSLNIVIPSEAYLRIAIRLLPN